MEDFGCRPEKLVYKMSVDRPELRLGSGSSFALGFSSVRIQFEDEIEMILG